MFNKSIKEGRLSTTYTILPTSVIPPNLSILDKSMYTLLQQIVCLIRQQYDINNEGVKARFASSDYAKIKIILLNEDSNKEVIDFLKSHNGITSTEQYSRLNHLVIAIDTSDLVGVLKGLEELGHPSRDCKGSGQLNWHNGRFL